MKIEHYHFARSISALSTVIGVTDADLLNPDRLLDRTARSLPIAGVTGNDIRNPIRPIERTARSLPITGLSLPALRPLLPEHDMFGRGDGFLGGKRMMEKILEKALPETRARTAPIRLYWPGTRPFRHRDGRRLAGF